ncbi:LITAF-like zinc ribbon domain-containing protein [Ditylenchus destructor]|uniref:LITAF-like zinc ribbon domain-containing protein n=1 Tax=Ditylenchus destructor TaxID=166010 RepID=A0AAD4N1T5_9BILA|nr:LITAF-like zinc ribbon domain-containing protein [Ditylenchus destructor]
MSAYCSFSSYDELPKAPYPSLIPMAPNSMRITCPSCHHQVSTMISRRSGLAALFSGALLLLLGCICCVFLPCCLDSCQDVKHTCPNCGAYLGKYAAFLD